MPPAPSPREAARSLSARPLLQSISRQRSRCSSQGPAGGGLQLHRSPHPHSTLGGSGAHQPYGRVQHSAWTRGSFGHTAAPGEGQVQPGSGSQPHTHGLVEPGVREEAPHLPTQPVRQSPTSRGAASHKRLQSSPGGREGAPSSALHMRTPGLVRHMAPSPSLQADGTQDSERVHTGAGQGPDQDSRPTPGTGRTQTGLAKPVLSRPPGLKPAPTQGTAHPLSRGEAKSQIPPPRPISPLAGSALQTPNSSSPRKTPHPKRIPSSTASPGTQPGSWRPQQCRRGWGSNPRPGSSLLGAEGGRPSRGIADMKPSATWVPALAC